MASSSRSNQSPPRLLYSRSGGSQMDSATLFFGKKRCKDPSPTTRKRRSRREALAEGDQQPRRSLDADAAAEQRPDQAPLFCQEPQPRLAVGGHAQVSLALKTVLHLQGAIADRDGCLRRLLAGEREMVDRV